jgi:hypothetical protein
VPFARLGPACGALASPAAWRLGAGPLQRAHAASRDGRRLREAAHDELAAASVAEEFVVNFFNIP